MEFNEKLQLLRKQKSLTQEELAARLYVSRAAVSKWESGRGYPNIDSLKALSKLFSVSIDELLSGGELLTLAEEDAQARESRLRDVAGGLVDCSAALLLFLPLFGEPEGSMVRAVPLIGFTGAAPWLVILFFVVVGVLTAFGMLTIALRHSRHAGWHACKARLSPLLTALGTLIFSAAQETYAAAFLIFHLIVKVFLFAKNR